LDALAADHGDLPRRLDPASPGEAPARLILDERTFRYELNQNAMATEKLADGIRLFAKDLSALRALGRTKLGRPDAAWLPRGSGWGERQRKPPPTLPPRKGPRGVPRRQTPPP